MSGRGYGRGSAPRTSSIGGSGGGGSSNIGMELVVNGAFAADTDWTKGAGWTIAAGVATSTNSASALSQLGPYVPGRNYVVTFTVSSYVDGTITPSVGGTNGTARGADGTFTETIKCGATTLLAFTTATAASLNIDNVTVRDA